MNVDPILALIKTAPVQLALTPQQREKLSKQLESLITEPFDDLDRAFNINVARIMYMAHMILRREYERLADAGVTVPQHLFYGAIQNEEAWNASWDKLARGENCELAHS
jgi:hypothetical protein